MLEVIVVSILFGALAGASTAIWYTASEMRAINDRIRRLENEDLDRERPGVIYAMEHGEDWKWPAT